MRIRFRYTVVSCERERVEWGGGGYMVVWGASVGVRGRTTWPISTLCPGIVVYL